MGPETFLEFTHKHLRLRALRDRTGEKKTYEKTRVGTKQAERVPFRQRSPGPNQRL
jgi:hypothetical protein